MSGVAALWEFQGPSAYVDHMEFTYRETGFEGCTLQFMMAAYFDESGTDNLALMSFAGFMGRCEEWAALSCEWSQILIEHNLAYFHAREFGNPDNFAPGGPKDRAFRALYSCCCKYDIHPVSVVLNKDIYKSAASQRLSNRATPYTYCAHRAITDVYNRALSAGLIEEPHESIHFVLAEGHRNQTQCGIEIGRIKTHLRPQDRFTWADARRVIPLQAADLFAREICADARAWSGNKSYPKRGSVDAIFNAHGVHLIHVKGDEVGEMSSNICG